MALFENFVTKRYAPFTNLVPTPTSVRSKFPLVSSKQRAGADYEFPVQVSNSQGITRQAAQTGGATLNTPISPTSLMAIATVPNMYNSERCANADIMRAMNGVSESGQAGAYFEPIDFAVRAALEGHENQLELDYLWGAGTGAAVAEDIGVAASATGTNLGTASYRVRFTAATWSEGIWNLLTNAKLDIYAANGSTPVAVGVTCVGVSDASLNEVEFFLSGSSAIVAATNRFVLQGALGASIYGTGAILRNTGTLFNIPASVNFWKSRAFNCGGTAFTSAKLMQACAQLMSVGAEGGLVGFVHPLQFQDIVQERDALVRYAGSAKDVDIGTDRILFQTAAGPVELMRVPAMKQGEAHFVSQGEENAVSIGSCLPQLVGADGSGPVVQRVSGTTNHEVQTMSSCAPMLRKPARNLRIYNIVPAGSTNPA